MILGIDTSCYTTSLALAEYGLLLDEKRRLLPVKDGTCGLRQSDAFFSHIRQLPELFEELWQNSRPSLTGICVSVAPRAVKDSYMPVFSAGLSAARLLAAQAGVPLYETTHQEGHLAAALYGTGFEKKDFLALHLSGGTTELLSVHRREGAFDCEILGSSDLAAGQMVDRVGVALGLPFPAGRHMDAIAEPNDELSLPVSVNGCEISFSGPESAAQRLIKEGCESGRLAYAVFDCIARSLHKAIKNAVAHTDLHDIVIAGGVASNSYIRSFLQAQKEYAVCFAQAQYASDNAVGVALLGAEKERMSENGNQKLF